MENYKKIRIVGRGKTLVKFNMPYLHWYLLKTLIITQINDSICKAAAVENFFYRLSVHPNKKYSSTSAYLCISC